VQPLVHRLLHLFVGPERLASHRLLEWSKDVKIADEYGRCGRHSKDRFWIVATKHLYSEVHVIWT